MGHPPNLKVHLTPVRLSLQGQLRSLTCSSWMLDLKRARGQCICAQAEGSSGSQNAAAAIGSAQAQFQVQAVAELRRALRNLGSDLIIRIGRPEQARPRACARPHFHELCQCIFQIPSDMRQSIKKRNISRAARRPPLPYESTK